MVDLVDVMTAVKEHPVAPRIRKAAGGLRRKPKAGHSTKTGSKLKKTTSSKLGSIAHFKKVREGTTQRARTPKKKVLIGYGTSSSPYTDSKIQTLMGRIRRATSYIKFPKGVELLFADERRLSHASVIPVKGLDRGGTVPFQDIARSTKQAISDINVPEGVSIILFNEPERSSFIVRSEGNTFASRIFARRWLPITLDDKDANEQAERTFDPTEAGRQAVAVMKEAEGGSWTGAELRVHFGLSSAALHKRRSNHGIVFWKDATNQFHYPKWQFNQAGSILPGIRQVLKIFRSSDEWRVMRYFLGSRSQLGDRTPLDLMRAGEKDKVIAHAKVHAEENTW